MVNGVDASGTGTCTCNRFEQQGARKVCKPEAWMGKPGCLYTLHQNSLNMDTKIARLPIPCPKIKRLIFTRSVVSRFLMVLQCSVLLSLASKFTSGNYVEWYRVDSRATLVSTFSEL